MAKMSEANETIMKYLKLDTYPLAVKFVREVQEFPKRSIRIKNLAGKMATCQAVSIARRWGWTMAVEPQDLNCPAGILSFGWASFQPGLDLQEEFINFMVAAGYTKDREAAERTVASIENYKSSYNGLVLSPLEHELVTDPQVILIYGNAAQISRLIQSMVYVHGGTIKSEAHTGLSCVSEMIKPMLRKEALYIIPGRGERTLGLAANDELAFAFPLEQLEDLLFGIEATDKVGSKYPIPAYLFFEPAYTPQITELYSKIIIQGGDS